MIASIIIRCPQLEDTTVHVTQVRQALHDQARRDESALEVLQGIDKLIGARPDATMCSGMFARYLVSAAQQ